MARRCNGSEFEWEIGTSGWLRFGIGTDYLGALAECSILNKARWSDAWTDDVVGHDD